MPEANRLELAPSVGFSVGTRSDLSHPPCLRPGILQRRTGPDRDVAGSRQIELAFDQNQIGFALTALRQGYVGGARDVVCSLA